jgi:class 3 adenylate cyclase
MVSMISVLGCFDTIDHWIYQEIVALIEMGPILHLSNEIASGAPARLPNMPSPAHSSLTIVLITAAAFTAVRIALALRLVPALGVIVVLAMGYEAIAFLASVTAHRILDLSAIPAALMLGHAVTVADGALLARWQRRFIRQSFSRHVPSDLAKAIWQRRDLFLRGGRPSSQVMPATVLFADMRGFTLDAETRNAELLMERVSHYRETMARVVVEHGGMVEGYFGDALKASFGVPVARECSKEIEQDASQTVACALAMGEALQGLNRRWHDQGAPDIVMQIGVATGNVTAVCVGPSLKFTTAGDIVRSAAQLVNDPHDPSDPTVSPCSCRILIGAATASHLHGRFRLYPIHIGSSELARISEPVYRVFGRHDRAIFNTQADPRTSSRIPVILSVTVASEPSTAGLTINVSSGGMAVCRLAHTLSIGSTTMLQLEVPGHDCPLKTPGTVVWAHQDQAGISFAALPSTDQVLWESFLISEAAKQYRSAA